MRDLFTDVRFLHMYVSRGNNARTENAPAWRNGAENVLIVVRILRDPKKTSNYREPFVEIEIIIWRLKSKLKGLNGWIFSE